MRVRRDNLPRSPLIVVTLSEGTEEPDERVVRLAREEAAGQNMRVLAYHDILDEFGVLCHVFSAEYV